MLSAVTISVTPFMQNACLLFDDVEKKATVVDPGGDVPDILAAAKQLDLTITAIFLTHAHIDHGGGVQAVRNTVDAELQLYAHQADQMLRGSIAQQAMMFGLPPSDYQNVPEPDVYLADGDAFAVDRGERAESQGTVLFTPGHAPGHIALFFSSQPVQTAEWDRRRKQLSAWSTGEHPLLLAGDTLFAGSIGRTDLPGGNHQTLINSIEEKLMVLPDDTLVLSGHGESTTIGRERRSNPFLREARARTR